MSVRVKRYSSSNKLLRREIKLTFQIKFIKTHQLRVMLILLLRIFHTHTCNNYTQSMQDVNGKDSCCLTIINVCDGGRWNTTN